MKHNLLCVLFMIFIASELGAELIQVGESSNTLELAYPNATETLLEYHFGQFQRSAVQLDGNSFYKLRIDGEGILQERGKPELPVYNRSIIIPNSTTMHIEITEVEYTDLPMRIVPSKGIITRDIDPETIAYEFGDVYNQDAFYPEQLATLSEPYVLRDLRGITIRCNPLAYNPVTATLRVYTSFKVRVYALGTDAVNVVTTESAMLSRDFMPIYERHFVNWQMERYSPVSDAFGKLLVICHSSFINQIAPYVNWKRQKGITTELIDFSSIGTTATQLKTYIQNRYNADTTIAYVQLVGDAPQIPSLSVSGGGSDPSFALVAGTDSYPDIFIGRFSATTTTELNAQINKAIAYERDTDTGDTWLQRAMGIASAEGGGSTGDMGESDIQHMNNIRTDLLNDGYTSVDQIYDPGASASTVTTNVNTGRGFINYVGHGNTTSWTTTGFSNTHASNLTNGDRTPFIVDVACQNGNFVSTTCFAEAWLRNTNGGAVAMYASSINQSWNSPMRAQDECTDLLVAESKTTIGGLFFNASCKMMDIYGSDGINMFKTWHIFGDASLQVRSKTPIAMEVTHPKAIISGSNQITVNTGVSSALVAITYNNVIYAVGTANASGTAILSLNSPPSGSITFTITVTAFNQVTYVSSIRQVHEPRMVAEWEPALGAVIRYPVGLPYSLISDLSNASLLYVVVSAANQASAASAFSANGVNMANVRWLNASSDTYWIRDYGPWTIMDSSNSPVIVDFPYNRPRPNDDAVPGAIATSLGIPWYAMNITHTGGNIMTDGQGKAMSTQLVLDENPSLSQSQIEQIFATTLGISDYQLYPDPNNTYIDHIDCWAKLLDIDKVLIRRVPSSHPQFSAIESVVAEWQSKTSALGMPYRIFRVDTPNNEPYSNSYILNNKIYVPQMGTTNDAAALQTYQYAMPGYEIEGYSFSSFESTDAIHCRVNTIFDPQLVSIQHVMPAEVTSNQELILYADIDHSNAMYAPETYLAWKAGHDGSWQNVALSDNGDNWTASLVAPAAGDTIFYWINATDIMDKSCKLPLCGANDPFRLVVNIPSQLATPSINIVPMSSGFNLSWEAIPLAQSYQIYASSTPSGEFNLLGTTTALSWNHETTAPAMFYRVVALWLEAE